MINEELKEQKKKEIEELKKHYDSLYEQYCETSNKIEELEIELLDIDSPVGKTYVLLPDEKKKAGLCRVKYIRVIEKSYNKYTFRCEMITFSHNTSGDIEHFAYYPLTSETIYPDYTTATSLTPLKEIKQEEFDAVKKCFVTENVSKTLSDVVNVLLEIDENKTKYYIKYDNE